MYLITSYDFQPKARCTDCLSEAQCGIYWLEMEQKIKSYRVHLIIISIYFYINGVHLLGCGVCNMLS